jgi:putative membrane-bound dehydrogenase-like protein
MSAQTRKSQVHALAILASLFVSQCRAFAADPLTGPRTEKRFPPLKIPKGFKATLFACDPLLEYPSVIALGPKRGTLFVAHDYVTGLGIKIVRRDEVRLLRDTDGDGYADKSTLFAGGFNSIQGLAYDDGTVFVMHAPLLTMLRDTDGDGLADFRRDIVKGLGLSPEKNPNRLHCANGVVAGHDGWLYLALGDRGCDVKRPEGDRLLFQQGGILRCRPDGRDLHVFAGGLRNIYDVALDAELNVFVRDNENDGGDYMIRVCRSFFGADHGYPYLYNERPEEALPPLADLGRGSSAGGTSYLETAFPPEFRESLFFCEWGRAVVRYRKARTGSHFARMKEIDFAAGAPNDPYGFKPTDLVVDRDGSLLISDWADGQRPKRGRGRIYRVTYVGKDGKPTPRTSISPKSKLATVIAALDSPGYFARVAAQRELQRRGTAVLPELKAAMKDRRLGPLGRLHAVWLLARLRGAKSIDGSDPDAGSVRVADLLALAKDDTNARVRAQAVRALADLTDPVLVKHRLAAGRGDEKIASRLAALVSKTQDARVDLEVVVALGRLRWPSAPDWLKKQWDALPLDPSLEHAAMQLLRRSDNWPAVLKLLDLTPPQATRTLPASGSLRRQHTELRTIALRALAARSEIIIVDGLIKRLKSESNAARRREYVDALARVYKKPAAWTYWGFRPAPRPANSVAWERTTQIGTALDKALGDRDVSVRMTALKRMRRENVPIARSTLAAWLRTERHAEQTKAILEALATFSAADVREPLERVVRDKTHAVSNRLAALAALAGGKQSSSEQFFTLIRSIEDGPVLAAAIREFGRRKAAGSEVFLLAKLNSRDAGVRAAAVSTLAERGTAAATKSAVDLLSDSDVRVRRAAAFAVGKLKATAALGRLRTLAAKSDREVCRRSLESLLALKDGQAVPQAVAALKHSETQLAALAYLAEFADAKQTAAILKLAETSRSTDVTLAIVRALSRWRKAAKTPAVHRELDEAIATVHFNSGVLLRWSLVGPMTAERADRMTTNVTSNPFFQLPQPILRIATGTDAAVPLPTSAGKTGSTWFAIAELGGNKPVNVEFLASASGTFRVWLNGNEVYRRKKSAAYRPDSDRFAAKLVQPGRRLVVRIDGPQRGAKFHLRFRTKSSKAEHERLVKLALNGRGSALRGREVFVNAEKSQCIKCHRMDDKGGRIGPDLTGIGSRFSKIHLVESLLEPSRTIAPSYATYTVALASGRVLSGVKVAETATTLTLGDKDGKTHDVPRRDIELMRRQSTSTMPDGLEKRLSDREFLDLIAFLLSQTKRQSRGASP